MKIPQATKLILLIVFLLFSGVVHELAHAVSADKMGDPTPRHNGRLTLNPIPHLDPIMSFVLPALLFLGSGGSFIFGGAKPVAMNPMNFRDPEKGHSIAAALGPASNFAMATIALVLGWMLNLVFTGVKSNPQLMIQFSVFAFYYVNVLLGVFNLIPIPPLDGSRVLRFVLPREGKEFLDSMERYGMIILLGVIAFVPGLLHTLLNPFLNIGIWIFGGDVVSLL